MKMFIITITNTNKHADRRQQKKYSSKVLCFMFPAIIFSNLEERVRWTFNPFHFICFYTFLPNNPISSDSTPPSNHNQWKRLKCSFSLVIFSFTHCLIIIILAGILDVSRFLISVIITRKEKKDYISVFLSEGKKERVLPFLGEWLVGWMVSFLFIMFLILLPVSLLLWWIYIERCVVMWWGWWKSTISISPQTRDQRKYFPFSFYSYQKIFISFSHLLDDGRKNYTITFLMLLLLLRIFFLYYRIASSVMQRRKIIEKVQKVNIFSLFSDVVLS